MEINKINNNIEDIADLDSSWLEEFENLEKVYKDFYTESITFTKLRTIYVNKSNEIEKMNEEKILFKNKGVLTKEELISIIKHNSFSNKVKYSLLSILKFNIDLEPIYIKSFIKNKLSSNGQHFLHSIRHIDDIPFDKTISMFQDLNELIIVFHENINTSFVSGDRNGLFHTYTKKIFIKSNTKKKTKRNQYKDFSI
jgi:hypothetical protein